MDTKKAEELKRQKLAAQFDAFLAQSQARAAKHTPRLASPPVCGSGHALAGHVNRWSGFDFKCATCRQSFTRAERVWRCTGHTATEKCRGSGHTLCDRCHHTQHVVWLSLASDHWCVPLQQLLSRTPPATTTSS
jgi:hypothetical protein